VELEYRLGLGDAKVACLEQVLVKALALKKGLLFIYYCNTLWVFNLRA